jgi:predicted house-cleaning noncanonical NTP pyrophosphatase (MazG superfamily)|tara:strand:+ start:36 stop:245 length:210 start_codon:yes stop_codon:yes gene_type:complete
MSFIKNLINENKDAIIDKIFDDELQEKLVKKLNENIDIPFISEATEEKALNAMYDSIEDIVKTVMKEKL